MELRGWRAAVLLAAWVALPQAWAQTVKNMAAEAHPKFEVATIKPSDPANGSSGFHTMGHRIGIENETVSSMFAFAYGIHATQIMDAPAWVATEKFDVDGVPDVEGMPNLKQYQEMVQHLLEERFHIRFHRAQRELSIYALTVAKGGAKMAATKSAPDSLSDQTGNGGNGVRFMRFTNNSMGDFTRALRSFLDRPVVDRTGLTGKYDFMLRWTPESVQAPAADAPPGMFTAMQEELGLKVEATKGMVEVDVIDHVERPSAN